MFKFESLPFFLSSLIYFFYFFDFFYFFFNLNDFIFFKENCFVDGNHNVSAKLKKTVSSLRKSLSITKLRPTCAIFLPSMTHKKQVLKFKKFCSKPQQKTTLSEAGRRSRLQYLGPFENYNFFQFHFGKHN